MVAIGILGLGEAGRIYASELAAQGAQVVGFDPYATHTPATVRRAESLREAVADVDLTLSLVGAGAAQSVAQDAVNYSPALYADLNTMGAAAKKEIAGYFQVAGVPFVDVAVMAPVPRGALATPLMASGTGARLFEELMGPFAEDIEYVSDVAGDAAARKLLRSVFMKGLAALVLECQRAGEAAGCEQWLLDQIASELGPDGSDLVQRLITGSHQHAERRTHEMEAASAYLSELQVPSWMSDASAQWLRSLIIANKPPHIQSTST